MAHSRDLFTFYLIVSQPVSTRLNASFDFNTYDTLTNPYRGMGSTVARLHQGRATMSSFELREEVQALQDGTCEIGQEHDVEAMDEGGIHDLLDGA